MLNDIMTHSTMSALERVYSQYVGKTVPLHNPNSDSLTHIILHVNFGATGNQLLNNAHMAIFCSKHHSSPPLSLQIQEELPLK